MFRISILALIFGFASIAAFAEDARQLTCSGTMIEPSAMSRSPETVILTLGPAQKLTLDLGQGAVNARKVSDNEIQSARQGHVRSRRKPTLVGLKENQRINPLQSKLPRQRVSHHPAEVHACPTVHSAPCTTRYRCLPTG